MSNMFVHSIVWKETWLQLAAELTEPWVLGQKKGNWNNLHSMFRCIHILWCNALLLFCQIFNINYHSLQLHLVNCHHGQICNLIWIIFCLFCGTFQMKWFKISLYVVIMKKQESVLFGPRFWMDGCRFLDNHRKHSGLSYSTHSCGWDINLVLRWTIHFLSQTTECHLVYLIKSCE